MRLPLPTPKMTPHGGGGHRRKTHHDHPQTKASSGRRRGRRPDLRSCRVRAVDRVGYPEPDNSPQWFAINGVPLADLIDQLNATSGDFLSKDEPDAIATCQRASYDITLLDGGLTDVAPTGDTRLFADLEFALAALAPGISACERGGLDAKVVSPEARVPQLVVTRRPNL